MPHCLQSVISWTEYTKAMVSDQNGNNFCVCILDCSKLNEQPRRKCSSEDGTSKMK